MATFQLQPESALTRPLALRMRPDLRFHPQSVAGVRRWGVKDPLSQEYFQLSEEEYAILQMLDGRTSLSDIRRKFEDRFAPMQLGVARLQTFLAHLYQEGLLLADAVGQGDELLQRRAKQKRRQMLQSVMGILAVRLRGIDPDPLLNRLEPHLRGLFSRTFLTGCLLLMAAALLLIAVQFDALMTRLPEFRAFFTPGNVALLVVCLAGIKVLHEFGHALTCKHLGGECHEMGLYFLVFTPCLYCNVSDSWMLPDKWRRAAIAAAGIFVELVLAAACTFLWWFTNPGLFNSLCLNVMFIGAVSTVLFNGNPLLRYDGYYVLSDLVEIPNLAERSGALLRQKLSQWCLGLEPYDKPDLTARQRWFLGAYGVASLAYRVFVIFSILYFLYGILKPMGLEVIVSLISVCVVAGLLTPPVMSAVQLLKHPGRRRAIDRLRLTVTAGVLVAAVAAVGMIPVPYRVRASAYLESRDAQRVFVSVPGRIEEAVDFGTQVESGDVLARLTNLNLQREIVELSGERRVLQKRLDGLEFRRGRDPEAAAQIPSTRERLRDIDARLAQRREDEQRLVLAARRSGVVLPPPVVPAGGLEENELAAWSGTPFDDANRRAPLETGTLVCQVGDPHDLEAVLIVHEADVEFVSNGQRVRLLFDQLPGRVFTGTVIEVGALDLDAVPRELIADGELATVTDAQGEIRLKETSYQARVALDDAHPPLLLRARGRAKIEAEPQTLALRLYRFARRTFRLRDL